MRTRLSAPALTLLALFTLACGKTKPEVGQTGAAGTGSAGTTGGAGSSGAGTTGRTLVTISGTAAPHPLNAALAASEDFSQLTVAIVDPAAVLTNPTAAPAASMTLDTTAGNCTAGCKFSLSGVDITNMTLGLVGTLEDKRMGAARVWVKTGTGMGTGDFLREVKNAPAPITDRRAFAVSRKLEAKLVAYVNSVLGTTLAAGDLEARGFLIGHVVGKLSEGTPDPAGVAGATVVAAGTASSTFDLIYPNADFSGKGTSTAASGIFLMIPKTAAPIVTTWNVVPPANDARSWPPHLAGSNPSNAFVIILPADE
jgi:hypothetical protein